MFLFGGVKPISRYLFLDILLLTTLYASLKFPSGADNVLVGFVATVAFMVYGKANRWPITFPLVLFVLLQVIHSILQMNKNFLVISSLIYYLRLLLVILSAFLSTAFPVLALGDIDGPYDLGVIDTFINGVSVKIWYPVAPSGDNDQEVISYLDPEYDELFCSEQMRVSSPEPLKPFAWLLFHWRLVTVKARRNAPLLELSHGKHPVIIYSHGLTSNSIGYTYQATNMVTKKGMIVVMIDHADGSGIVTRTETRFSTVLYDRDIMKSWKKNVRSSLHKPSPYVRKRREQTECRVNEFTQVMDGLKEISLNNAKYLDAVNVSFAGRINVERFIVMGHSFGAATAISVAAEYPELIQAVIAHEPATEWMTDRAVNVVFKGNINEDTTRNTLFSWWSNKGEKKVDYHRLHNLVLFSDEWRRLKLGEIPTFEKMYKNRKDQSEISCTISELKFIKDSHHTSFSDALMLTPSWIARVTGLRGHRDPHDCADEILRTTLKFLDRVQWVAKSQESTSYSLVG